jgi:hypothetical protein
MCSVTGLFTLTNVDLVWTFEHTSLVKLLGISEPFKSSVLMVLHALKTFKPV